MSITTHSDDVTLDGDEVSRDQFTFRDNESTGKDHSSVLRRVLEIGGPKALLVLGAGLAVLFAFAIVATLTFDETGETGDVGPMSGSSVNLLRSIVVTSEKKIWALDVDSKRCSLLRTLERDATALDTYLEETVFWSDNATLVINSLWKRQPSVTHARRLRPQAMAVDYVTDKLYFVDRSSGALGVIDLKRPKNFGLVFSDLEEPHDLVLDPAEGLMFVVLFYRSIMKANMDGSSLRTVVESPKVSAIAIDRKATRIYWANDQTSIESSDYDGTNRQMVIAIPMSVISLTTTDNQLFWTRAANWSDMCPCSNALWTCALYRRTCNNVTFHKLPFDSPRLLRTSFDQRRHLVKNPCAGESNGGCEQLCLMTAEGSHGCACNVGWTLNADGKTCSGVSKLLVYAQGEHFRARILGMERNESFAAAVVPTRFRVGRMNKKTSVHFDYDMVSGELYFSDDLSIYRINLLKEPAGEEEETEEQTVVLSVSEAYAIKDVVYDWSKNGILYIKQSQDGSSNHSVVMHSFKLDVKAEKTVLTSKFKKEAYIDCPHNLAIQPNHEYLFFSDYNGVNDNLRRVSSNGKGLILWKPFYSNVQLIFLAIDSERSRLYWSTSVSASMIKSANLEGSEEETVQVLSVANLLYAGVKDQWLYVGNHTEIWAVKRDNGADPVRLVKRRLQQQKTGRHTTYEFIHGLRIYSLAARNVT